MYPVLKKFCSFPKGHQGVMALARAFCFSSINHTDPILAEFLAVGQGTANKLGE